MPHSFSRSERYADQIQRELAHLVYSSIKDPRLRRLSITHVKVSNDLSIATVYVTFLQVDQSECQTRMNALTKATSYLRRQLAQRLAARYVPVLKFVYDFQLSQAQRVAGLIDRVVEQADNSLDQEGE